MPPPAAAAMPPSPPLTLIVATTPRGGIGAAGALPWPQLRAEMAYFARVTRRAPPSRVNAVVMGRRTWDSIPARFRPLAGRLNAVVSRSAATLDLGPATQPDPAPLAAPSLAEAVRALADERRRVHRVFVIGGAEIYAAALQLPAADRVLRTRVRAEFECDVFFPVALEESAGWERAGQDELDAWVGENVPAGTQSEKGVEWEFEMWTRKA